MKEKVDLVLIGSIIFFCGTVFKTSIYYVDVLFNVIAFPMFLFVLAYFVWYSKFYFAIEKKLLLSILAFLLTTIRLSVYIFISSFVLYVITFAFYMAKESKIANLDIDNYSFVQLVKRNNQFFNVKVLGLITLVYYFAVYYVVTVIGIDGLVHKFW